MIKLATIVEGRTGGSQARFMGLKSDESRITDIIFPFSRITKIGQYARVNCDCDCELYLGTKTCHQKR